MSEAPKFLRDEAHWLLKLSPDEWIRAAMAEMRQAEAAYKAQDARSGLAGCRRAAGMGLNAAVIAEPGEAWGRSYVQHIQAVGEDEAAPEAVRRAARLLMDAAPLSGVLVSLRTKNQDERLLEAARDLIAHAYAVAVRRHEI